MGILPILGILLFGTAIFLGGGLMGWLLKGLGSIFDLLLEGNRYGCGCILKVLFWIFAIMLFFVIL